MSEAAIKGVLRAAGAVFLVLFTLTPFVFMLAISVTGEGHMGDWGRGAVWTLEHYRDLFLDPDIYFVQYFRNSLIVSAVSAFFAVAVASLAAYAITRLKVPGRHFVLMGVLAVSMFPPISLAGYLFRLMAGLGWMNTHQALVLPYISWILPLSLWILVSYFSKIPVELDRAAMMDGCSHIMILRKIILPVAAPGILSTGLLAFIAAFNEFMFALMLTVDHHARTLPVGVALFEGLHGQTPWGSIMAASTVTVLPLILLTLLFQKKIIQGLTQGALKG